MSKRLFNETKFTTAEMLVVATVLSVALLLAPSMASAAELVSVNNLGTDSGNAQSFRPEFSADGRFVVFASDASDIVPTDTNDTTDIFVRDRENGITDLASINSAGTGSGKGSSGSPAISADGRFIAFVSFATDLVAPETNGKRHIFVRDRDTGTTTLVSVNSAGIQGDANSSSPVISADGQVVAFASEASNLVSGDTNDSTDVFVRALDTRMTTLVSVNSAGIQGNANSSSPVISADGQVVAFASEASNLVSGDTNDSTDVFVRDLDTGMTTLVSVTSAGASGDNLSLSPVINADGQLVAFVSFASNLVATDTNRRPDVFVRDLQAGTTMLVSVNIAGVNSGSGNSGAPVISPDGRLVAFQSSASNLVTTKDTNGNFDVFVRDLQAGTTMLVSVSGTASGNRRSDSPVISADGRFVAFRSFASDLASPDTDMNADVFVRDLQTGTTTLLSVNSAGTGSGGGSSEAPVISVSADGRFVAFRSFASDLVGTDNNGVADVFVSVIDQEAPAVVLIIDEDSIDNGNFFAAADINDHIAQIGLRTQLPFFAANVGNTITLHTGQMGDEGWFALKTIPASWGRTNDDGLRNFVGQPSQPFPHNIGEGLGRGSNPEALLDKVPDVTPLRADGLERLKGEQVCAVVYDSDISINYAPLNGNLKGATLGTVAFEVMSVTELTGFSSSSLPQLEIKILDAEDVCKGQLTVF